MNFIGTSLPLSEDGFNAALQSIGTQHAELWSVIAVETSGCGYFPDRRPQILFERHLFYKLTRGRFPASDINSHDAGGYTSGPAEYDRLARAMALDQQAALESASWGIGQVLGQNFKAAGYSDVTAMVTAMVASEDAQLKAVCGFLTAHGLDRALRDHDWAGFARGYNGPNYVKYSYDTKLQQNYQKFSVGSPPDLRIRTAQLILKFLKYNAGAVDGMNGAHTESAVKAFQSAHGLAVTGDVDDATIAALQAALNPAS
jgi:hypothetical protein